MSQEDRYLIFIFNMDILVITTPFSLTIKADAQYIYMRSHKQAILVIR